MPSALNVCRLTFITFPFLPLQVQDVVRNLHISRIETRDLEDPEIKKYRQDTMYQVREPHSRNTTTFKEIMLG